MSHNSETNAKQMMVVLSMVEEWSSLKNLLQERSEFNEHQVVFSSLGTNEVCDLTVEADSISLHYGELKEDMTEENICQVIDSCFKSCRNGITTFLLLIQGGYYTKRESRLTDILQAQFGAEALKYLVILSVEDGTVTDTLDDTLLDLINTCNGRYCRITSTASGGLHSLFEMVSYMLTENFAAGYTEAMLAESKRRCTEDSAMNMLKQKMQEAEERELAFQKHVRQQEERRARELEELKTKHAEERRKEEVEKKKYETKRESLHEAVFSHKAMLQLQARAPDDDETKKTSVILLGLSGSGKSAALNLILNRAGNHYSVNETNNKPAPTTVFCERKKVFAEGKQHILVDTPELWDEDGLERIDLVKDSLALALPGPHVFLLVLQVGRFTQGECEILAHMQKIFGREVVEHTVILFVHVDGNQSRPQKINDYVSGAHSTLQELVRKCGSRYYELNVTKSQGALSYPQVKELLTGIYKLVASHGGRSYSVKRFSHQELQERKKVLVEGKEGALEGNYLLRDD